MLNPFISTRALRLAHSGGAMTLSIVAHTALIVIAVTPPSASSSRVRDVAERMHSTERVHLVAFTPRESAPKTAKASSSPHSTHASSRRGASLARLSIRPVDMSSVNIPDIEPAIADIDFMAMTTDSLDFAHGTLADVIGDVLRLKRANAVNGVYTADAVGKVVRPYSGNPKPEYPPALQSSGVEGELLVEFVVDTAGHVETKSIQFLREAHPLFVDAVRRALRRARFLPAELDGRRVPQLVSQLFAFRMAQ